MTYQSKLKIRKARKSDLKKIQEIIYACRDFLKIPQKLKEQLTKDYTIENLQKDFRKIPFFVSEHKGKIYSTGRLDPNREIRMIYVDPKIHRRGAGSLMIEFLEDIARKKGLRKVFVHALPTATGFYKKLDYKRMKNDLKYTKKMSKKL